MSDSKSVDVLMEGLRFVNKVISPLLVHDWCLRCAPFIESTKKLFRSALISKNYYPSKRKVMQIMALNFHEFLSMMCNSEDRQTLIIDIHKPNFISHKQHLEGSKNNFIYTMNLTKKNFVDAQPQHSLIEKLNFQFNARVGDQKQFKSFLGLIDP